MIQLKKDIKKRNLSVKSLLLSKQEYVHSIGMTKPKDINVGPLVFMYFQDQRLMIKL